MAIEEIIGLLVIVALPAFLVVSGRLLEALLVIFLAKIVQTAVGAIPGCLAGGAAGTLVLPFFGTIGGCIVGGVIGGEITNTVGSAFYVSNVNNNSPSAVPPVDTSTPTNTTPDVEESQKKNNGLSTSSQR